MFDSIKLISVYTYIRLTLNPERKKKWERKKERRSGSRAREN